MRLPEDDETYLGDKGYSWELVPDGPDNQTGSLIIKDFEVCAERYDRSATDLLLRIPAGYNNAQLDMFWVDPPVHLKDGSFPPSATVIEQYVGRQWQRFSRHLSSWRPGVDGLPMFLALVQGELQGAR